MWHTQNALNWSTSKLTHWGRVTHICVSKLTIVGSDNGLSPCRCQSIIWTNAGILLIWTSGTNFSEILSEIHEFSFKKMAFENIVCEMASILSRRKCVNMIYSGRSSIMPLLTWAGLFFDESPVKATYRIPTMFSSLKIKCYTIADYHATKLLFPNKIMRHLGKSGESMLWSLCG